MVGKREEGIGKREEGEREKRQRKGVSCIIIFWLFCDLWLSSAYVGACELEVCGKGAYKESDDQLPRLLSRNNDRLL